MSEPTKPKAKTTPRPRTPIGMIALRILCIPAVSMLVASGLFVAASRYLPSRMFEYGAFGLWSLVCLMVGRWTVNPFAGHMPLPEFNEQRVAEMLLGRPLTPASPIQDMPIEEDEAEAIRPHVRGL